MTAVYKIRSDAVTDEEGTSYIVYGVDVLSSQNANSTILISVPDVFFKRADAECFVSICNIIKLSPAHLMDFAEAFIDTERF